MVLLEVRRFPAVAVLSGLPAFREPGDTRDLQNGATGAVGGMPRVLGSLSYPPFS